ncbi:MAG: hypothetical protein QME58_14435, partial [Bacteroidota bacterium]|nr:hypothetical protein [Bacteroidota bacterium]
MIYEPVMDPEEIEQLLMDALQYRASGMYQNAIANYQQIISGDGTIIQALVELRETYTDMLAAGVDQTNQWRSYLQTLQTHYNPPMARTATIMLAHEYAKADMLNEAFEKYQHALTLGLDTETRISLLLSKMMLEGFELGSEGDAEETYLNMKQQFPNDERTQLAQFELELINGAYSSVEFGKVSEFKVAMRELPNFPKADQKLNSIPEEYRIEQNYPNPFNPS